MRRRRLRVSITVAAVAALIGVTAIAVRAVSADASGCNGQLNLTVAATAEIAPVLTRIGNDWSTTRPQVNGECVEVDVAATPAPDLASRLADVAGGTIDVEAPPTPRAPQAQLPDVWIPDSTAWLGRVQAVDRSEFTADARSVATSPVVFAMPEAAARRFGWPASPIQLASFEEQLKQGPSPVSMVFADPHRDTAGLVATMLLGSALSSSDSDLPALVRTFRALVKTRSTQQLLPMLGKQATAGPASEQAVVAYNAQHPPTPLAAVQLEPAPPNLDYPYAIRSDIAEDHLQAAEMFRDAVLSTSAQRRLAEAAFRDPDGHAGPGFPAVTAVTSTTNGAFAVDDPDRVQAALNLWAAVNEPPKALALFDVSASMKTAAGSGGTRAQVMVAAADQGLSVFTADTELGMWTFAGSHQEILPIAPLTEARRATIQQKIAAATPTAFDQVDLYGAVADAYENLQSAYDPTRPDFLIVLTDGGDSSAGGQRLKDFTTRIEQLADPTEPIRIIIIGIDADQSATADLTQIAHLVGGGYFSLTDPSEIQTIFFKSLLAVGEA
jgi:Mg-chelatase subunit ChlD